MYWLLHLIYYINNYLIYLTSITTIISTWFTSHSVHICTSWCQPHCSHSPVRVRERPQAGAHTAVCASRGYSPIRSEQTHKSRGRPMEIYPANNVTVEDLSGLGKGHCPACTVLITCAHWAGDVSRPYTATYFPGILLFMYPFIFILLYLPVIAITITHFTTHRIQIHSPSYTLSRPHKASHMDTLVPTTLTAISVWFTHPTPSLYLMFLHLCSLKIK